MAADADALREVLEDLYAHYTRECFIDPDPIGHVRRYADPVDREIVALLAAGLAYGRVRQILNSLDRLLPALGPSPSAFLDAASPSDLAGACHGFKHRWTSGEDIVELLTGIKAVRERFGSLEVCFLKGLPAGGEDALVGLSAFVAQLRDGGGRCKLLADPLGGSACKRLHLFLRWMVRKDEVDPGGWEDVPRSLLIVPLDTHMHRVGVGLGFTCRKQADAKTAIEITEGFRCFTPQDPVRYDFALTRPGIRDGTDLSRLGRDPVEGLRRLCARPGS